MMRVITKTKSTRKQIRFKPDPGAMATLDTSVNNAKFQPTHTALILNESHDGCCLVLSSANNLRIGDVLRVKVGLLDVQPAEVRWMAELDSEVHKVGLKYR